MHVWKIAFCKPLSVTCYVRLEAKFCQFTRAHYIKATEIWIPNQSQQILWYLANRRPALSNFVCFPHIFRLLLHPNVLPHGRFSCTHDIKAAERETASQHQPKMSLASPDISWLKQKYLYELGQTNNGDNSLRSYLSFRDVRNFRLCVSNSAPFLGLSVPFRVPFFWARMPVQKWWRVTPDRFALTIHLPNFN